MVEQGFARGQGSPVVFWRAERDLACVARGDDFTFCGEGEDLDWVERLMTERYEV